MVKIDIKIIYARYPKIKIEKRDAHKLRGFFGENFSRYSQFHNHTEDGFMYGYPKIQYKTDNNSPLILGIEDDISILHKSIMDINEIIIEDRKYSNESLDISLGKRPIGISKKMNTYMFLSPCLLLNQENFKKYKILGKEEKKLSLDRVVTGNILSMCKGLNIHINEKIIVDTSLGETYVNFKNTKMIGFYGKFNTNFNIPNYFGIGKSVSRGFGTIKQIKEGI